jgi:hypothetical protein
LVAAGVVGVVLLSLVLVWFWRDGGPPRWGASVDALDAEGAFRARVTNLGGRARDPYCTVTALDAEGAAIGSVAAIGPFLEPGERWVWRDDVDVRGSVSAMEIACR